MSDASSADSAELRKAGVDATVGVGPWPGDWPADERLDPHLLQYGDTRNVIDRYRYWRHDPIVADLDSRRHSFHVAIENWQHDFNIGSVVRTANAFLAAEVHIVGLKRWNRRGAMVTDRYQHIRHHASVTEFTEWARYAELPVLGVDNLPGAVSLESAALPRACVLVFGQEGPGLTPQMRAACRVTMSIAQFGSTRSINAGAAAAIAMHAWVRQHAVPDSAPAAIEPVASVVAVDPVATGAAVAPVETREAAGSVGGDTVDRTASLTATESTDAARHP